MSLQQENIDKLMETIKEVPEVYQDIKKAKESGNKITWAEGGAIAIKHGGKAIRFISNLQEIGNEVIDLESDEAQELIDGIKAIYTPNDPLVESGAESIIKGMVYLKEGIECLVKASKK